MVRYLIAYYICKTDIRCAMRFLDLKEKEVINCRTGKRLGYISDIVFDECGCNGGQIGQIEAFIVPCQCKLFSCFTPSAEYLIRFCDIKCIGPDIIVVDICEKEIK